MYYIILKVVPGSYYTQLTKPGEVKQQYAVYVSETMPTPPEGTLSPPDAIPDTWTLLSEYDSWATKVQDKWDAVKAEFVADGVTKCSEMLGKHEVLVAEYMALYLKFVESDT